MIKKTLSLLATAIAACGIANADVVLSVSVSGQFSGSDIADSSLVAPNGKFSLSFYVDSNPTPLPGTVTSLSFDVPVDGFSYTLNNALVSVTPSEITFNTLSSGGLFDVTFGSGLSASEFVFEGAQAFSGTTAAPVFAKGQFAMTSWTFSDPANYDFQTPTGSAVTVVATPEPSTILLLSSSLAIVISRKLRKG